MIHGLVCWYKPFSKSSDIFGYLGSSFDGANRIQLTYDCGYIILLTLPLQAFFTVSSDERLREPVWVFNSKLVDSDWVRYPVRAVHPLEAPHDLRNFGVLLQQTGSAESVIPAALKAGIFLSVFALKSLHGQFRFKLPAKGEGSGKNGAITKPDYVHAMLRHFFGEGLPDDQKAFMISALMGKRWDVNGKGTAHASEILAAFKSLDQVDQPEFVKLAAVAQDEEALKQARAERTDMKAAHASPMHETPKELSRLLPVGPDSFLCRFNRHPKIKRYQVYITDVETGALFV